MVQAYVIIIAVVAVIFVDYQQMWATNFHLVFFTLYIAVHITIFEPTIYSASLVGDLQFRENVCLLDKFHPHQLLTAIMCFYTSSCLHFFHFSLVSETFNDASVYREV